MKSVNIRSVRRGALLFSFLVFALAGLAGVIFRGGNASATPTCSKQWTGAHSTGWTTANNWSPAVVPTSTDYVCIDNTVSVTNEPTISGATTQSLAGLELDGHTLTVNGSVTLTGSGANASSFASGTITGTGTLTVSGTLTWVSGTMTGTGSTTFAPAATVNIAPTTTSGYASTDTRTVTNNGTVNLTEVDGGYPLYIGINCDVTSFVNAGTFNDSGPAANDPGIASCGTGSFTNNGTFTKTAGAAATPVTAALNQGSAANFNVNAGSILLSGGSSTNDAGTFTGTSPGQVQFTGGTFTFQNATFAGGVNVNGATVSVNSGNTVTVSGSGNAFTSGDITGAGGFTVSGSLNWVAGAMDGAGQSTFASTATVNIAPTAASGYPSTDTRTVTNNGTVNLTQVSSGYSLYIGINCDVTSFVNNGTFNYSGPAATDPGIASCGTGSFTNNGTFNKTAGAAATPVSAMFNQGSAANFNVSAGSVQLGGGSSTSDAGTFTGTGPGQVQFTSSTFTFNNATFAGGVNVFGGAIAVNSGNTLTMNGNANTFTSGDIGGAGNITVTGTLNWAAGTMDGSGSTTFAPTATVNIAPTTTSGYPATDTRTVTNNGTVNLTQVSSGYSLYIGISCNPTGFVNNGTFTYGGPTATDPGISSCGTGSFTNNGTFTKSAGSGVTSITTSFSNSGTINENAGTLVLQAGLAQFATSPGPLTGGTYSIQGNLQVPSLDVTSSSATVALSGANAKFNDTSSAAGTNGLRDLATNTSTGSLTVSNGKQLSVKNLSNAGTVVVGTGAGSMLTTAGNYTQSAGSTTVSDATSKLVASGGAAKIDINGGTLSGIGTVQTATATNTLTNAATVSAGSPASGTGNLSVSAKYTQTAAGTLNEDVAGTSAGSFDQISVNQPVTLAGTLAINTSGSYAPTAGDTLTILSTSSGTVTGTFSSVTGKLFDNNSFIYEVVYNPSNVQLVVHQATADLSAASSSPADVTADPTNAANNIAWTLTVGNGGPAPATNVTVTDTIPPVSQFVSAVPSQGSCATPSSSGVLTCNLGAVAANPASPPTVVVTVKPLDPAGPPSAAPALTNQASVAADQPDANSANNSVSDSVNAAAQTGVTYVDDTDSGFATPTSAIVLGKQLQYTFLGTLTHHLTDSSGFVKSGTAGAPRTFYRFKAQAAGSYVVSDSAGPGGTSTIAVPATVPAESSTGTLTITWSKYATTPAGYGYDVTITGPLGTVTNLAPTRTEKSATYTPTDGAGNYTVSARILNTTTAKGNNSQSSTVNVKRAIRVSPTSGAAGTTFTVTGKGFAHSATVTITFGATALTSATTNASGAFTQIETVPSVPAGPYTVTATDGSVSSSTTFTVM